MNSTFFPLADLAAIAVFGLAWCFYHFAIERGGRAALNSRMDDYRMRWMREMARREARMTDSAIMSSLQNGTAFFASTSLLAIGGAATLLRAGEEAVKIAADLPLGIATSRGQWEAKVVGLLLIFGYAFYKFSWSYRLFNYAAIMMGATPDARMSEESERMIVAERAGRMNIVAARHFSRGQRALFFALAYMGWFLGPYVFMVTTLFAVYTMWARQYRSDARLAAMYGEPAQIDPRTGTLDH